VRGALRKKKVAATVKSVDRLEQQRRLEEDLRDLSLVAARMLTTGPRRYSMDEVLEMFGFTREQLRDLPE
jgi:hypothetical protein